MPKVAPIKIEALAERMVKVLTEVVDERDRKALREGQIGGDHSRIATEIRSCLAAYNAWLRGA